ncbi:folate synthesis bifunctional protein, mitochondrial-like isoform X1 [Nymphaea colorata]|nr:folate synthesis bifunctional protein, mitochondrial-like isoform X1 [Nymphaea colorata]XP_031493008.1 folate synthesis bifunctional protein, mitochondrial-like isoform X1 [Nymphaea colorata]XP_031493010.1 folate synthesis bifunctional protein, mitochondrial-like isoform X1 [Nymphaea colorata]XP_031493011.1 folate synthesis bifunctional protein, mitochondrial-like isoform X1 [Nymphaea colorata]
MKTFKKVLPRATYALRKAVHSRQFCDFMVEVHSPEEEVVIALGSNVGNRIHNFDKALSLMKKSGITITRHACLYETEPAYVTEQPLFLNSAIRGFTKLQPHELLRVLKQIEKELGRTEGIRYGPRPIDLDVLFYGKYSIKSEILSIPHERIWERPFVVAPLIDLLGTSIDTDSVATWHSFSGQFGGISEVWKKLGGESSIGKEGLRRVLPIGDHLWDWSKRTHVMGVLNLTPDSFSDGGKFISVDAAVSHVRLMISEGADIIDIGGQSTRPLAPKVSAEEELKRLMPVLKSVINIPEAEGKLFSVDTYHSKVASEVIAAGVHFVNDVSGGRLDTDMFSVVAGLGSPYIMMHMRGDPSTMQNKENVSYEDVCKEVANELYSRVEEAEQSGIPSWRIIIDPGIGFSKTVEQNLEILMGMQTIRKEIAHRSLAISHAPMLIGPSRKSFLGKICDRSDATERDPATIASVTAGILAGANIIRVHNVKDNLDAAKVCDALLSQRRT